MRPAQDAYGAMMLAALDGRGSPEIVERDDGLFEASNYHETYMAPFRRWPANNRRAMRLLSPGGILLTCSCSYNLSEEQFVDVVRVAAGEAHRSLRVLERRGQPADHPILLEMPESAYLKGILLEAVD